MAQKKQADQARNLGSPVQDAVAKVAMNPKLSYEQIAEKVREMVDGAHTSAKSVASLVLRLRKGGAKIPARERPAPAQGTHAHA